MVDNMNPNTQFHPYQGTDAIPQTGSNMNAQSGLSGILSKVGLDQSKIGALKGVNLNSVQTFARGNGGLVLGGLAALAIGAGLWRRRSMSTSVTR